MGLLDILNGMQTGGASPTGQGANPGASQGMSPIAKALLGLLAVYANKNRSAPGPTGSPGGGDLGGGGLGGGGLGGGGLGGILGSVLGGGASGRGGPAAGGGGLGDILGGMLGGAPGGGAPGRGMPPSGGAPGRGMPPGGGAGGLGDILGGLLGGAGAGTVLNGGLGDLLKQFEQNGQGDVARSWVGTGPNKAISPQDLESALGGDTLDAVAKQSGMGRGALVNELSQHLPRFVDQLTPGGRLPTQEEAARMI